MKSNPRSLLALLLLVSGCSTYGWADGSAGADHRGELVVSAFSAPPHLGLDTPALRRELIAELEASGIRAVPYGATDTLLCELSSLQESPTEGLTGHALILVCDLTLSGGSHPHTLEARSLALRPVASPQPGPAATATQESLEDASRAAIRQIPPQVLLHLRDPL